MEYYEDTVKRNFVVASFLAVMVGNVRKFSVVNFFVTIIRLVQAVMQETKVQSEYDGFNMYCDWDLTIQVICSLAVGRIGPHNRNRVFWEQAVIAAAMG